MSGNFGELSVWICRRLDVPGFQLLQQWQNCSTPAVCFYLFDVVGAKTATLTKWEVIPSGD
jgi:hypothetical protein